MIRIAVLGDIGSGKSYVARNFGFPVFNADIEAKNCMAEDKELIQNVKTSFGENMYDNGVLQKEKLAKIVFNNSERLAELNALVHPVVKQRFEHWCTKQTAELIVKEAAILFESDAHLGLDAVICISANDQLRIIRVKKRDGCSDEEIKNRMNKQMPQAEKEELADFVIVNNEEQLLLPQLVKVLKEME